MDKNRAEIEQIVAVILLSLGLYHAYETVTNTTNKKPRKAVLNAGLTIAAFYGAWKLSGLTSV